MKEQCANMNSNVKLIRVLIFSFCITPLLLNAQTYNPPIGIPAPEFGIEESHTMYADSLFDFGNGPEAYKDAGNGPFTHYVDKDNPNATDTGNQFGIPSLPRLTIPVNLLPGSVVEVHNGPYAYSESIHGGTYLPIVNQSGTASKPIFIRGANSENRFEIGGSNQIIVRDVSYLIMENVLINGPSIKIYQPTDHFSLRHSEVTGESSTGVEVWTWKTDFTPGDLKEHLVFYDNDIHDNGPYPSDQETNSHGFIIDDATQNLWILDNRIYNNGDDGIHIIDRYWIDYIGPNADRIFIGRNEIHHDGENAIDVKGSTNVILSQNEVYGYATIMPSSSGEAIRINDEGDQDNIWILYNRIYDSEDGINPLQALFPPYIIGNIIYDCDIAINVDAELVLNNTIYNTNKAVAGAKEIANNIIVKASLSVISGNPQTMSNNLFWQNGRDEYCDYCFSSDPLFVEPDSGDFRLQPGSPAMENGISHDIYDTFYNLYGVQINVDFDGNPRPLGPNWDIGPYEYAGQGTKKYFLSVNTSGRGGVSISPDGGFYSIGTEITLTAVPDSSEQFIRWEGDLSGTENPQQLIMDSNKVVQAIFTAHITDEFIVDSMEVQSEKFEARWNAYASVDSIDGVMGFSQEFPTDYSDLSCKILFDRAGDFKVSDSWLYKAEEVVTYSANQNFVFRMSVDIDAQTYSVWVTPEGENEILIADTYSFHLSPGTITSIKYRSVKMSFDPQWGGAEGMVKMTDFNVVTDLENEYEKPNLPSHYSLSSYPNPFNPSTSISYDLPKRAQVKLTVYDINGAVVTILVDAIKNPGKHSISWDATNSHGKHVASGLYVAILQTAGSKISTKMIFIR